MRVLIAAVSVLLSGVVLADTQGEVHPEPAASCQGFKPHHLCFDVPDDGIARAEYFSRPFYAVILESAERCSIPEEERLQAQALFPQAKVFSERFYCGEDIEEFIRYTNVNDKFGFLAVHAGATLEEANKRLLEVKATDRFAGANIRKMQAVIVFP